MFNSSSIICIDALQLTNRIELFIAKLKNNLCVLLKKFLSDQV